MKKIIVFILIGFLSTTFLSCNKYGKKMEIVKDCTGTYLQKDNVDYLVCNSSILDEYAAGDKIKVEYDLLTECFGLIEGPVCLLYHPFESRIEITKIN